MSERPRIITTENVLTSLSTPQGAKIAGMLFTANWGPIDDGLLISNFSEFVKYYGTHVTGVTGVTGYKAAKAFFNNGGVLRAVRVAHTGYTKATHTFKDDSSADALIFSAKYHGTYGDFVSVSITDNGSAVDVYITDGVTTETYYSLATNAAVVSAVNASSNLCTVEVASGSPGLVDAVSFTYLTGGNNGTESITDSDYTTAFDTYLNLEEFDYLILPGKTDNAFQVTMLGKLNTRAINEGKYSTLIVGVTKDETISTIKARTLSGKNARLVAPSLILDGETLDGSYLACSVAGALCNLPTGTALTNKPIIGDVDVYYTKIQQDELLNDSVLVVTKSAGEIKCIKDMTRHSDLTSPYKLGVIVDEINYARRVYERYLETRKGTRQDEDNRAIIQATLDILSSNMIQEGVLDNALPSSVTVVVSKNSYDSIVAKIGIMPVYSIDYIYLTLNIQ